MTEMIIESKRWGTHKILIDKEDLELVSQYKWFLFGRKDRGNKPIYAIARVGKKQISMHRLIMGCPEGMFVIHVNGNRFDNRKENLQILSTREHYHNIGSIGNTTQAALNSGQRVRRNQTGLIGVTDMKKLKIKKWRAKIERKHIGYYKTAEEAARAYDAKAKELYGEFARLNFPEE